MISTRNPGEPTIGSTQRRPAVGASLATVLLLAASACGSNTGDTDASAVTSEVAEAPEYGDDLGQWSDATGVETDVKTDAKAADQSGIDLIEWEDLVAPGFSSDEIYDRYADRLDAAEDGSPEAEELLSEMQAEFAAADTTNTAWDGKKVQLSGFVAPLTYEDELVTQFLLVPYFGACVHVPPPPANQTIVVTVDKAHGLTVEDSWGAVWVAGELTVSPAETDLAQASYHLSATATGAYDA